MACGTIHPGFNVVFIVIIVPLFGEGENRDAMNKLIELYPDNFIQRIDSREIAEESGVLNCITWNIKSK